MGLCIKQDKNFSWNKKNVKMNNLLNKDDTNDIYMEGHNNLLVNKEGNLNQ